MRYLVIPRMTDFSCEWDGKSNIYELWPKLTNDQTRNKLIVDDIIKAASEGRFPLILTERRGHLQVLSRLLQNKIENLILLHGGLSQKERKDALKVLEHSPSGKAILATGAYIGEGFDRPQLDTLFLLTNLLFMVRL